MTLTANRNIKYLLITHLIFLIFIAFYCFFVIEKPSIQVLAPIYSLIAILTTYSQLFLPVSAGALFVLIIRAKKNKSSENPKERGINFLLSTILALAPTILIYIFLVFFAEPVLIEKRSWLKELSDAGKVYLQEAEKKLAEENIEEALILIDLYLYIDPNNKKAIDLRSDILIAWPKTVFSDELIVDETVEPVSGDFLTGQRLIELAERFYALENYSSAAYFGQMAVVFRSSRDKATEITRRAIAQLSGFFPDTTAEEKLFDGKTTIVNLIEAGNLYDAYYFYHTLSEEFPGDRELRDIGERLFSILSESSFLYEEIRSIYFAPGKSEVAFINSSGNAGEELIFARKVVFTKDAVYLFDINIINLSPTGQIIRHLKSLYGKVIEDTLNMQCMERDIKLLLYPDVIVGNINDRVSSIKLGIPAKALVYMGLEKNRASKIRTPFLIGNLELLSTSGMGKYIPTETLFLRFIRLCNYIFIMLFVIASGISFLKRRIDTTYLSIIVLPLVVAAVYFLEGGIMYIKERILLLFMKEIGMAAAALCLTAIIAVAFIAIIFYIIAKASSIEDYKD